ncbi:MAG: 2-oxoacid:acceptor oxidoreductase subunit alpha [Spirochaetales bacterium]|nr:MAG: 2-oxoacid:acceptor oxidoreductase subunit alpha [Spirochaetales bacterium]
MKNSDKSFTYLHDLTVRICGEGGEGVISAGELFAQAASRTEFHVFTFITYPAEIRGGYSMIQVRIKDATIYSLGSRLDCLTVFNQEAYNRSIHDLKPDGLLIYDPETVKPESGVSCRLCPLELSRLSVRCFGNNRGKNTAALGVLGYLFDMDNKVLSRLIADKFGAKGQAVVENNIKALTLGYEAGRNTGLPQFMHLVDAKSKGAQYMLLSGNEAVALGALTAGCTFIAGYPITPATPIFETLARTLPLVGGRAVQMEDEIAALSAVIGASWAGHKVITATSGPGFQLMTEQLSLASMVEVPLVLVDVQRGGPSTGMPTKTEQGDLNFAVYGFAGESPRIILAPTSVQDTYYQTIRAFNLAERYQLPVILLLDQSIAYRKATVQMPDLSKIIEVARNIARTKVKIPTADYINLISRLEPGPEDLADYRRYRITEDGVTAMAKPGNPGGQYIATGLEHDEYGFPNYTPKNHLAMSRKRLRKLKVIARSFDSNPIEIYGKPDAKLGIIGWGSTEGAIREARYLAKQHGIQVRHLHPHTISPLPERQINHFLAGLDYLVIVEENLTGQFANLIKAKFGVRAIEIHKCEGIPITPEEILAGLIKVGRIADEDNLTGF